MDTAGYMYKEQVQAVFRSLHGSFSHFVTILCSFYQITMCEVILSAGYIPDIAV